jgi:hypothetical protein
MVQRTMLWPRIICCSRWCEQELLPAVAIAVAFTKAQPQADTAAHNLRH